MLNVIVLEAAEANNAELYWCFLGDAAYSLKLVRPECNIKCKKIAEGLHASAPDGCEGESFRGAASDMSRLKALGLSSGISGVQKRYVPSYIRHLVMQWPGNCGSAAKSQEGRATGRGTPLSRLPPPSSSFVTPHLTSRRQEQQATRAGVSCFLESRPWVLCARPMCLSPVIAIPTVPTQPQPQPIRSSIRPPYSIRERALLFQFNPSSKFKV